MEAQLTRRCLAAAAALVSLFGCSDGSSDSTQTTTSAVTRDEYAQAVFDAVACIEATGLVASAAEQSDGSFGITITSQDEGPDVQADVDAVYEQCTTEHLNDIQIAYLDSIRPDREEAQAITRDCLADLGLLEPGASDEDYEAVLQSSNDPAIADCISLPYSQPSVDE